VSVPQVLCRQCSQNAPRSVLCALCVCWGRYDPTIENTFMKNIPSSDRRGGLFLTEVICENKRLHATDESS